MKITEIERLKKRVKELRKKSMLIAFIDILPNECRLTYNTGNIKTELFFKDVEAAQQYCMNLPKFEDAIIFIDNLSEMRGSD